MKPVFAIFFFAMVAALGACTSKTDQMIGKWNWSDGSSSEYLDDGTFASSAGWSGKWTIKDDILTISGPLGINQTFQILEISSNTVKLRQLGSNKEIVGNRTPASTQHAAEPKDNKTVQQQIDELQQKVIYGRITQAEADRLADELRKSQQYPSQQADESKNTKRDIAVNDLNNIAAQAYMFRLRPKEMQGGGGSYEGYSIPSKRSSGVRIVSLSANQIVLEKDRIRGIVDANGKLTRK